MFLVANNSTSKCYFCNSGFRKINYFDYRKMGRNYSSLLFWASTETEFHKCYRMIPGDTSQAAYSNSSSWLPHPSPPLSADSESVLLYILTRYSYLFF